MEKVFIQDCGDGVRRADVGCFGKGPTAKTADYTIKARETGTIFTNTGASGVVKFTLPAAKAGMWFTFIKTVVAQAIWATASGGAKINGGTANKSVKSVVSELASFTLVSNGTDWFIQASFGTIAQDNS